MNVECITYLEDAHRILKKIVNDDTKNLWKNDFGKTKKMLRCFALIP